jgi:hypothetical protein
MAAGNDFGRAVLFGGVVDRPKRTDAERGPRPRHFCAAVVKVPGLHGLAGMQVDGEQRRQEAAWPKFGLGKGQRQRMDRKLREDRRFRHQRIDAIGLFALKIVSALEVAREMRRQRGADIGNRIGRKHALEDQIAAAVEFIAPGFKTPPLKPRCRLRRCCRHGPRSLSA